MSFLLSRNTEHLQGETKRTELLCILHNLWKKPFSFYTFLGINIDSTGVFETVSSKVYAEKTFKKTSMTKFIFT